MKQPVNSSVPASMASNIAGPATSITLSEDALYLIALALLLKEKEGTKSLQQYIVTPTAANGKGRYTA